MKRLKKNEQVLINALYNGKQKKCVYIVSKINKDKSFELVAQSIFTIPQKITVSKASNDSPSFGAHYLSKECA